MRLLFGILFALATATLVGLGLTYQALVHDTAFGSMVIGSWTAWPQKGTPNADPYARASIARSGQLSVALGDGVSFTANTDNNRKQLDGRCNVKLTGITPAARFWTLTLYTPSGELVANSLDRHGFSSQEIVRQANGDFSIMVGPRASSGNWLPSGGVERYILVLRFYDTPVGVATSAGRDVPMPTITTENCL